MNNDRTRFFILVGAAAGILLILGAVTIFFFNRSSGTGEGLGSLTGEGQNEYVDPGTGETVLSPDWKTPETAGSDPNEPVTLGLAALYDQGMSQDEAEGVKHALTDWANQQIEQNKEKIEEVSLAVDSIEARINRSSGEIKYTGKLTVNRDPIYRIEMTPIGFAGIHIAIFEESGEKPVFSIDKFYS